MRVDGIVFATEELSTLLFDELAHAGGQMAPALQQIANVAGLPGIVGMSMGMPDIHCGYGFAIGNVAAVDATNPDSVVSPGGVGFDINCGVRLLRTNLSVEDIEPVKQKLADTIYSQVPVGTGQGGGMALEKSELLAMMKHGMPYLVNKGLVWPTDMERCEEGGCLGWADPAKVSARAISRGLTQVGTMGAGNHYCEVQVVEEIFDQEAANAMGIHRTGQVCIMIHSGSRGLGHQVCTDYLLTVDRAMKRLGIKVNDRQLACAPITSPEGSDYLGAMAAAANFAFCNRSIMANRVRRAFSEVFGQSAEDLDMHSVYDVCHNIAKFEKHLVDGELREVLVHRKGATRAFPPGHPDVPECYRKVGQPVLIGGSMGTSSYILTGTEGAMQQSFGSTCHGAGRELSRAAATRSFRSQEVRKKMASDGIIVKAGDAKLLAEEASGAYKDVSKVVETCHEAGISKLCVRLRPVIVVKG
eukprot:NODE_862_length_1856_cov_25.352518_g772_i0.p1 GENE.NODE_862_length_1856_cov_25.352518_g772_i0~~NODE_862_length_1856_cov_25.352518_g772_i0.p1  ORF type:complete len:472 (-),score=88.17 NODE_862_length_1856_cov_25.352518_g772_i0:126-1541(-)